jgi:large subunit ribosomal protein L43
MVLTRPCSSFIKSLLPKFAAAHPEIEITVSPRPTKHPIVKAHYINGNMRAVCTRNMHPNQIQQKVELLRDSTGEKNKKYKTPVRSINESVRGIWSPYHGTGISV